jgi:hypothetical protein
MRARRSSGEFTRIYIRCTVCRWEYTIKEGDKRVLEILDDVRRLRVAQRRGKPVDSTLKRRLGRLKRESGDDSAD